MVSAISRASSVQRFGAAQPLESVIFQHAHQLGLNSRHQRGDFVQHNRAAIRQFKSPQLALHRARECAAFVPK